MTGAEETDAVPSAQRAYHHTVNPIPGAEPLHMGDFSPGDGARHPHHPRSYEITDPAEIAEVRAVLPPERHTDAAGSGGIECMCHEGWDPAPVTPN